MSNKPAHASAGGHAIGGYCIVWSERPGDPYPGAVQEQIRIQPVLPPTPSDSKLDSRAAIGRAYQLLLALLTGDVDAIKDIQLKSYFINVIGIPRNGGSYLTKELYRSMGYDPTRVPNVISHDGFQDVGPFRFDKGVNSWITSLQTMAEYLTMVEIYFGKNKPHSGKVVVPNKLLKGA